MKSFDSLIDGSAQQVARDNHRIRELISQTVPASALPHVVFCRVEDSRLRITVDQAGWIAHLRFAERRMLAVVAQAGLNVRSVSWHVAPAAPVTGRAAVTRQPHRGSTRAASTVRTLASSMEPGRLQDELLKMAAHLGQPPPPKE